MATHRQRLRAARPGAEILESRQLLAATLRGVDFDGDRWELRLVGPGDLSVTQQPGAGNVDVPLGRPGLIETITIAGTDPNTSRLYGIVRKSVGGDGKIFFQSIEQLGGISENISNSNLGINAIDMPQFWLGQTSTATSAADPSISLPFGVSTFRFGGADVTFTAPGGTPLNQNNQSDTFTIDLGLPFTWGTSIIVDQVITDAQAATGTGNPTQDGVTFTVLGRINTFSAREILGNTQFPPSGFEGDGGTIVQSTTDTNRGVTGAIGYVRVSGDATNFSVQTNDKVRDFYIEGETSAVFLLAPEGSRYISFGKGMDDVTIRTKSIQSLQANRGAVGSEVTSTDHIGRITIGGDVVNTFVLAGYEQDLGTVFATQTAPADPPAKSTASINNVLIAGDVVDSIFAASVQPFQGQFDVPEALRFPQSHISAKVEGTISNENVTPNKPGQAFYAKTVTLGNGPVNPPNVPEGPFPQPNGKPHGVRVYTHLQRWRRRTTGTGARAGNSLTSIRLADGSGTEGLSDEELSRA